MGGGLVAKIVWFRFLLFVFWLSLILLTPGEIQCEDLVVLLSERAAREIYIKWTDTLMV